MTSQPPGPPLGHPPPGSGYDPADLSAPLYDADVGQAFVRFWRKYLVFTGRASPGEFWWWTLLSAGIALFLNPVATGVLGSYPRFPVVTAGRTGPGVYLREVLGYDARVYAGALVWSLVTLVGQLALGVRRLHDTGRSGWWSVVALVPIVGWVILVILWAEPARAGLRRDDR